MNNTQERRFPLGEPEQANNRVDYLKLKRIYRVFGVHYKKHWKLLAVSQSGLLLSMLVGLASPWTLKLILDYVILKHPLPAEAAFVTDWFGGEPLTLLLVFVLCFVVLSILDSIVSYLHKVGLMIAVAKMANDIRVRVFDHLQRLSLSFHESMHSGDLVYRLMSDLREVMMILLGLPLFLVYRSVNLFSYIGVMVLVEWRLALIAFSVVPILSYFHSRIGRGLQSAARKQRSKESDVTSIISESVEGMALIQAYGREELQQSRFEQENRQSLESGIRAMRLSKTFKRLSDILVAIGTTAVIYFGGSLVLDGAILPGTLVLFASYIKKLYGPIDKFAGMLLSVAKSQVSAERILELMESDMVVKDEPHAVAAPVFKGHIEAREVTFAYQSGGEVLSHLTFEARPGETVAVVGHSGAGKSTFVSLLLRFYDPQAGGIFIDGRDIRDYTVKSLRSRMTVVLQNAKLFNQTVRENVAFGKSDATEAEIIHAAKLAQAHDFIMEMPQKYDALIYEGGDNLSGGQRQRLNIARAIIRDTPILILDEPATALDAKAEAQIHEALEGLMKGRTTFIIAHKFSTIARADKILVLEKGQPAAFGTHAQLLQSNRAYRELYELQAHSQLGAAVKDQADLAQVNA
jgi:ATP-binding cassette subfamily B protein